MKRRFHGKDLRKGRFTEYGRPYLITTVTEQRQPRFQDISAGRLLVAELRHVAESQKVISYAWVVMPDHLHWLIASMAEDISSIVKRVKSRSAISVNRLSGRSGTLWQKGFHDRALRKEDDIKAVARYIIANPVRAGLVSNVGEYPLWDVMWL